jgi:RNA polymerase sigma-70 factor (ECF subfamily)
MESMSAQEFEILYERYKSLLYRIAFTYLKDSEDVADLLQEVFIKRLYHAPHFESEEHEKRWMIRVTVNLAKNQLKNFWRKNVSHLEDYLEQPECRMWSFTDTEKELYREMMSLPEKQRIALYLHYYEGYTCKEIAQILHCKESAVKMRLKKGREQLKEGLSE